MTDNNNEAPSADEPATIDHRYRARTKRDGRAAMGRVLFALSLILTGRSEAARQQLALGHKRVCELPDECDPDDRLNPDHLKACLAASDNHRTNRHA